MAATGEPFRCVGGDTRKSAAVVREPLVCGDEDTHALTMPFLIPHEDGCPDGTDADTGMNDR